MALTCLMPLIVFLRRLSDIEIITHSRNLVYLNLIKMDKLLKPERLSIDPNSRNANVEYKHWLKTFQNYITAVREVNENVNQLQVLINFVSATVYSYIEDCPTFDIALQTLEKVFVKPVNEIFARHVLSTREQRPDETVEEFLQNLLLLAKDCNFKVLQRKRIATT